MGKPAVPVSIHEIKTKTGNKPDCKADPVCDSRLYDKVSAAQQPRHRNHRERIFEGKIRNHAGKKNKRTHGKSRAGSTFACDHVHRRTGFKKEKTHQADNNESRNEVSAGKQSRLTPTAASFTCGEFGMFLKEIPIETGLKDAAACAVKALK